MSWHTALAWIEDLVEVKLNVGEDVATLLPRHHR